MSKLYTIAYLHNINVTSSLFFFFLSPGSSPYYVHVGLPSTSRPFPHLLVTPTGEPLHFLFIPTSCVRHIYVKWSPRQRSRRVDFEGKRKEKRTLFILHHDDWIKISFFFFPLLLLLVRIPSSPFCYSFLAHRGLYTSWWCRKLYKLLRPSVVVCWHEKKNHCQKKKKKKKNTYRELTSGPISQC